MIKVITGYRIKEGQDIESILFKLRSHAMTFRGFVGSENLLGESDRRIVATATSWEKGENWREWENSGIRQAILRELRPLLEEEPRITIYRIMPATGWQFTLRSS